MLRCKTGVIQESSQCFSAFLVNFWTKSQWNFIIREMDKDANLKGIVCEKSTSTEKELKISADSKVIKYSLEVPCKYSDHVTSLFPAALSL